MQAPWTNTSLSQPMYSHTADTTATAPGNSYNATAGPSDPFRHDYAFPPDHQPPPPSNPPRPSHQPQPPPSAHGSHQPQSYAYPPAHPPPLIHSQSQPLLQHPPAPPQPTSTASGPPSLPTPPNLTFSQTSPANGVSPSIALSEASVPANITLDAILPRELAMHIIHLYFEHVRLHRNRDEGVTC